MNRPAAGFTTAVLVSRIPSPSQIVLFAVLLRRVVTPHRFQRFVSPFRFAVSFPILFHGPFSSRRFSRFFRSLVSRVFFTAPFSDFPHSNRLFSASKLLFKSLFLLN